MASRHLTEGVEVLFEPGSSETEQDKGGNAGSETDSTGSSYSYSDYSNDLEPEWLDDVQKNGELFYLELSEGEEEALLAQVSASQSAATNHVHFSEKEAEIITENSKKNTVPSNKSEAKLWKLGKILRRKRQPSLRKTSNGKEEGASQRPTSILKNQAEHRSGVVVQQQHLKDVCVYLNPKRLGTASPPSPERGGLLEALLGVMHRPGGSSGKRGGKLIIHGLVPHSPASKCAKILIGDVLVAVDDVDVTSENIERVLSCIPGPTQVRLTLETVGPVGSPVDSAVPRLKASPPVSQLVRLLWGEDTVELQMSIAHIPHIVMFLSLKLDSESPQEEQDMLYQYPVSEASTQLKAVRGIFLTLCDMLENVTGGQIVSSSLLLQNELVHVGYWKDGSNLLVIGVPASKVPLLYLQTIIEGVVRTLKVMYGSLDSAFCEVENSPRLDHFFCLFFQQLFQPSRLIDSSEPPSSDISGTLFLDGLPAVRWLTLPPDIKVEVDTILSDFESSDFGEMSEDFYCMRRLYVILGSCLFYKRHFMQCVLLEAGGCASPTLGSPGPDCVYVDQVKATLLQLESLYAGIEERLSAPPTPCLSCADWFLPAGGRDRQDVIGSSPILNRLTAAIKPTSPAVISRSLFGEIGTSGLKGRRPSPQRSLSDSGSEGHGEGVASLTPGLSPHERTPFSGTRRDSLGSGGSDGSLGSAGFFKIPRLKHPNPFYLGSLKKSLTDRETEEMMHNVLKLTAGAENTLFHYVLMETVQGIFIAPTHREVNQLSGSIHPQLIQNFYHCCLSIRHAFQQSLPTRDRRGTDRPQSTRGLGPVKEHGVLFQCKPENWTDQKKPAPTMTYWVIGRMLLEPVPQEFYVCFHDSVAEVPVEMAFRLSFGLAM
ncbi:protein inturned-like isoform X4 [Xyrauchen texanus]|uniref:protein inturned-like isoform X4 n=1 Tax=Xyrauchen texanus TaxID=154827 RepID=UPI002242C0B1|nr:protein inturned-like isoform X4 [Xyrauchen texanus]